MKYLVVDDDDAIQNIKNASVVEWLNEMAADGWEFVSAFGYAKKGGVYTRYFFRRLAVMPSTTKEEQQ